jgi:hypothetical protein
VEEFEELKKDSVKKGEVDKMKEYVKNIENEYQMKSTRSKENETVLNRIRQFTCSSLKLQSYDSWESNLTRALATTSTEHINFMRAVEGTRVLFMPHSEGIYIALVLKGVEDIEQDQILV